MRMFRIVMSFELMYALLVSARCSTPAVPPAREAVPALSQRCTNPQTGVSIAYPEGWFTNSGDVMPSCSVFDARPIALPRESEIPFDIAVTVVVDRKTFNGTVTSSQFERVLAAEEMTIAGRRAVRIQSEATGEGLADRGTRSLRYEIDLGSGRTLVATTYDAGGNLEEKKEILSRMVQTISVR